MLAALEQNIVAALQQALPAASVSGGPQSAPAGGQGTVHGCVWARSWHLDPQPSADAAIEPEGVQSLARITATAIPDDALSFRVVGSAGTNLLEVGSGALGFARGEDYLLEADDNGDHVLRFFKAPPAVPTAFVSGGAAEGYRYRKKCRAEVDLIVWADNPADADAQSRILLAELLGHLSDFRGLDVDLSNLGASPGADRRMRWIESRLLLIGQSRDLESPPQTKSVAHFELRGEVEVYVALGAAQAQGRIESLAISQL